MECFTFNLKHDCFYSIILVKLLKEVESMKDNKLYSYICEKCEKRSIPIEELHKKCKFSRSSNYGYMCGLIPKSKLHGVEDKFSEVLKLNALEKRKLHELIYLQSLTDIHIHNMELIDSYVFDKQVIPKEKDLDFMFYNKNDIFSRAKSDILNIIFEESDVKNLYKIHIEHLISFPEENYENSLNILFILYLYLSLINMMLIIQRKRQIIFFLIIQL